MGGDLLELLFALALITFGLLGSRKKKKPSARSPQRRPAPRPPRARPQPGPQTANVRPVPAPTPRPEPREQMVRELERLLGGRVEVEQPEAVSLEQTAVDEAAPRTEESSAWAAGLDRGAQSLETLEEAGATSHERFHARYMEGLASIEQDVHALHAARLRRAIIWSEILAPPVSLRER